MTAHDADCEKCEELLQGYLDRDAQLEAGKSELKREMKIRHIRRRPGGGCI